MSRCEEELFDLQREKQELEKTLITKEKEIYSLQSDLQEARDVLQANQGQIQLAQPLVEKIDRQIGKEKPEEDESDAKTEMLSSIQ